MDLYFKGGITMYKKTRVYQIYESLIEQGLKDKYEKAGIYCIKLNDTIVYIGKSVNMLERIAQHLAEIEKPKPTSNKYSIIKFAKLLGECKVSFDVLYYSPRKQPEAIKKDIGYKEGVYIRRYKPVLNYQIPEVGDWHKFTVNKRAQTITLKEILEEV